MIDWRQWLHEPLFLSVLVAVGCAAWLLNQPWREKLAGWPRMSWVFGGLAVAYVAIGPPWEQTGRYYLFSAEMAEQLALLYGASALLVAGLSPTCWVGSKRAGAAKAAGAASASVERVVPNALERRQRADVGAQGNPARHLRGGVAAEGRDPVKATRRPSVRGGTWSVACGALFILGIGFWYLPRVHERALESETGLAVEHLCFLALGIAFWWPVLSRNPRWPALRFGPRMAYLLIVEVALAGVFTYLLMADHAIYPTYEIAPRLAEKLTPEEDQVLAGVLLSGVSSIVLVIALGAAFFAWAKESETATTGRERSTPARR